jgi:4-hydroxy-3-methylbut-2-enyl diphosphate reductase
VHHVQNAADLREEWFCGANIVGITAGTSTPDSVVDGVEQWLKLHASACGTTDLLERATA